MITVTVKKRIEVYMITNNILLLEYQL